MKLPRTTMHDSSLRIFLHTLPLPSLHGGAFGDVSGCQSPRLNRPTMLYLDLPSFLHFDIQLDVSPCKHTFQVTVSSFHLHCFGPLWRTFFFVWFCPALLQPLVLVIFVMAEYKEYLELKAAQQVSSTLVILLLAFSLPKVGFWFLVLPRSHASDPYLCYKLA